MYPANRGTRSGTKINDCSQMPEVSIGNLFGCLAIESSSLPALTQNRSRGEPAWPVYVCVGRQTFEKAMATHATAHPDRRLISSDDVQGTEVYGTGDESIGTIDHLLIEKLSGRVAYAIMSFG